ncbi:hypothetical protein ABW21_db0201597 [Orbilia brochopaga]|nr:hypothetical protein ABW21_db0201597 [Drechslerella brochopaga]
MRHRNPALLLAVLATIFWTCPAGACPTSDSRTIQLDQELIQDGNEIETTLVRKFPPVLALAEGKFALPVVSNKISTNADESNSNFDIIRGPPSSQAETSAVTYDIMKDSYPRREDSKGCGPSPGIDCNDLSPARSAPALQQIKRQSQEQHDQFPEDVSTVTAPLAAAPVLKQYTPAEPMVPHVPQGSPAPPQGRPAPPPPPPTPPPPPVKACRVPKAYSAICHPAVVPSVVLVAYLLATYFFYTGENPCCLAIQHEAQVQAGPPAYNSSIPFYFQQQQRGPSGTSMPSASASANPPKSVKSAPARWLEQPACFFLTTIFTYGAGLVILGSFLGGLCNCVKSECTFN